MTPLVAVLGTRYADLAIEREVLGATGARVVRGDGTDPDAIATVAGDADVIVAGSRPRFTAAVLDRLRCAAIVRSGVGVDSVDLAAARDRGIAVVHVPDYGTEAVAQHTLALVLAATRRLVAAHDLVRAGGWGLGDLRPLHLPDALTAGVIGHGRIGARVAQLLVAVGFGRVLAHDPLATIPAGSGVEPQGFDDLLDASDVVTLHVPGTADDAPLLDADRLARLRPGSVVVNTARGTLIDAPALAAALATGAPAVAALDVHHPEPPDLAVFAHVMDRVLLTPHMAWYSEATEAELRRRAADEARRVLQGQAPRHLAAPPDRPSGAQEAR
jgi:D-3-phosphoglycerate dehydrogenase